MTKAQQLGITKFPYEEYDSNGNIIYSENSTGFWYKVEYDSNGNTTFYEDSTKFWCKSDYDSNRNKIFHENSYGYGFFQYFGKKNNLIQKDYKSHYRDYILGKILK